MWLIFYKSTGKHLINHKLLLGYICWKHLNPITLGHWNLGMLFSSTKSIVLYFDISMKSCRREFCIFYVLHSTLMHQHWIAALGTICKSKYIVLSIQDLGKWHFCFLWLFYALHKSRQNKYTSVRSVPRHL